MRTHVLTLAGWLLVGGPLAAQQAAPGSSPAAQPARVTLDPANNRLDAHLVNWEQQMKGVQTLALQCTRTRLDKAFGTTDVYEGGAKYMKPDLGLLEVVRKDKPQIFEKFIFSGTYLYQYAPQQKVIHVHELPANKSGNGPSDDNVLSFMLGMKAEDAKRRYDIRMVKEDQWYVYLEVIPRLAVDKVDFAKARLVLHNKTYLPRELWFMEPNGSEVKWDIPRVDPNVRMSRTDFGAPTPPAGWKMVKVPPPDPARNGGVPPRVIRQNRQ